MSKNAAIIGAGQIGFASAKSFVDAGWSVTIHARSEPQWRIDGARYSPYELSEQEAPSADCVVDTIAFDAADIERYDPDEIGRLIAISSASVYCDAEGRTLDEAAQTGFPEFEAPVGEANETVAPGPATYSTRKVRMEQRADAMFGDRATILRPCAIHGPWSRHPREWWFVKRLLDGRSAIPVALRGLSRFHTTGVHSIGRLATLAAEHGLGGIYNVGDTSPPDVASIGQAIIDTLGHAASIVPVEGAELGRTPWSVPRPFLIDGSKSERVEGYVPSQYAQAVRPAIEWLADIDPTDWEARFPQLSAYPWDMFDYTAEDEFFTRHTL